MGQVFVARWRVFDGLSLQEKIDLVRCWIAHIDFDMSLGKSTSFKLVKQAERDYLAQVMAGLNLHHRDEALRVLRDSVVRRAAKKAQRSLSVPTVRQVAASGVTGPALSAFSAEGANGARHAPGSRPDDAAFVMSRRSRVRPRIPFSILLQADALLFALLGVRLERDVLAPQAADSHNMFIGDLGCVSWSTFIGLYWADMALMPEVVAVASAHQACGLFLAPSAGSPGSPGFVCGENWLDHLRHRRHAKLEFRLGDGLSLWFASFNSKWKFKSKRRREHAFDLVHIPRLEWSPRRLREVPVAFTRSSPLAEQERPKPDDDVCKATPSIVVAEGLSPMPVPPRVWDTQVIASWASGYPDATVRKVALEAVNDGVDPGFVGSRTKAVVRKNSATVVGNELVLRKNLMDEAALGRMWGPLPSCPFRYPRTIPLSMVDKDKHDPSSDRKRIISNLSAGDGGVRGCVNDLMFSPKLVAMHYNAAFIRERIAHAGPGARAWEIDVQSAFRNQLNRKEDLHLFVMHLVSSFGKEWFVDLCNPFGSRPSEYAWQCILAIILWECKRKGLHRVDAYVENIFLIFTADENDDDWEELKRMLGSVGAPLHEEQGPKVIKGLGWWFHLEPMMMECPADKRAVFARFLVDWVARFDAGDFVMSLYEVRTGAGFMQWLSEGFCIGKGDVASFICFRTKLDAVQRRSGGPAKGIRMAAPCAVRASVAFWHDMFRNWDGRCPIVASFGPCASWQVLGLQDASTDDGAGGVFFKPPATLLAYSHMWDGDEREDAFVKTRESTGAFELMGAVHWMRRFGELASGLRLLLLLDSASSVQGLASAYSDKPVLLSCIQAFRRICATNHVVARVCHILERFNTIADLLSHGDVEGAQCVALREFGIRMVMVR